MERFSSETVHDLRDLPSEQVRAVAMESMGSTRTISLVDGDCRECWQATVGEGGSPEGVDDLREGLKDARLIVGVHLDGIERALTSVGLTLGDVVRFDVVEELHRAEYLEKQLPNGGRDDLEGVCDVMGVHREGPAEEPSECEAVSTMECFHALTENEHYLTACSLASFLSYNDQGAEAVAFESNVGAAFAKADPDRPRPRIGLGLGASCAVFVFAVMLLAFLYGVIEPI